MMNIPNHETNTNKGAIKSIQLSATQIRRAEKELAERVFPALATEDEGELAELARAGKLWKPGSSPIGHPAHIHEQPEKWENILHKPVGRKAPHVVVQWGLANTLAWGEGTTAIFLRPVGKIPTEDKGFLHFACTKCPGILPVPSEIEGKHFIQTINGDFAFPVALGKLLSTI